PGRRPRDPRHRGRQAAGVAGAGVGQTRRERRRGHAHAAGARLHRGGGSRPRPGPGDPLRHQPSVPREAGARLARRPALAGRLRACSRHGRGSRAGAAHGRVSEPESSEGERLQKVLARAGFGSRRACEELIAGGRVTVDGERASLGRRVDPANDRVEVDGVPVSVGDHLVYYLLNKPRGVVTTASDPRGRPTVVDLVPSEPRVFSVGRLDADTEGLLLLTNDGDLANRLAHPSYGVEKEYLAEVEREPTPGALRRLRTGVPLE